MLPINWCKFQLALLLLCLPFPLLAMVELEVSVLEQELSVQRYPAEGKHLIIWVAPGFGSQERTFSTAERLAQQGVEVWHVDLAESLFLERSSQTMRKLDGRYLAGLMQQAHAQTGKSITLVTRSYGAIPVLRAVRQWQLDNVAADNYYLNGVILFSPELILSVPSLGLDPEYVPIIDASNVPIMVYQGGARGNRWQLNKVVDRLRAGGAPVYQKILKGVTGLFYEKDMAPATLKALEDIPAEFKKILVLLQKTAKPARAAVLRKPKPVNTVSSLDTQLKTYRGNPKPKPLKLKDIQGNLVERKDYRNKVTLINFWASWCRPCVQEIPSLNNLRRKMQGKAFELISVNYAETETRIKEFLTEVDVDFPVLMDYDGRVAAEWNVLVYPSTFVIGPDGRIHYGINAAMHWDDAEVLGLLQKMLSPDSTP